MKNDILIAIGIVLIIVVAIQSYFIYDLKQGTNKNQQSSHKYIPQNKGNVLSVDELLENDNVNPFQQMQAMQREMDTIFNNFNSTLMAIPKFRDTFSNIQVTPLSDFKDNGKKYEIKMNIPGGNERDIIIKAEGNQLSIEASIEKSKDDNGSNYFRQERYMQKFFRQFTLPNDADTSKLSKEYKNGVLSITIPKKK